MLANLVTANWSVAPLRELIRHIVLEYHDCFRLELPQLERCMPAPPYTRAALRALQQSLDRTLEQGRRSALPGDPEMRGGC